jgi:hypothetical protein
MNATGAHVSTDMLVLQLSYMGRGFNDLHNTLLSVCNDLVGVTALTRLWFFQH